MPKIIITAELETQWFTTFACVHPEYQDIPFITQLIELDHAIYAAFPHGSRIGPEDLYDAYSELRTHCQTQVDQEFPEAIRETLIHIGNFQDSLMALIGFFDDDFGFNHPLMIDFRHLRNGLRFFLPELSTLYDNLDMPSADIYVARKYFRNKIKAAYRTMITDWPKADRACDYLHVTSEKDGGLESFFKSRGVDLTQPISEKMVLSQLFYWSILANHEVLFKVCLDCGVDVNAPFIEGGSYKNPVRLDRLQVDRYPLLFATHCDRRELISKLVKEGARFICGPQRATPMHVAAARGEGAVSMLRFLKELGCFLDSRDRFQSTPLTYAGLYNIESAVSFLLMNHAKVSIAIYKEKPITHAFQDKKDPIFFLLNNLLKLEETYYKGTLSEELLSGFDRALQYLCVIVAPEFLELLYLPEKNGGGMSKGKDESTNTQATIIYPTVILEPTVSNGKMPLYSG